MKKTDKALQGIRRYGWNITNYGSMRLSPKKDGDYVSARRAAQKINEMQAEIDRLRGTSSAPGAQAAPAPSDHATSKEWAERMLPLDDGVTPSAGATAPVGFGVYGEYTPITVGNGTTVKTPAPSDGLREALEECDCCVDGLQADGETPCPYCTKPRVPVVDAAEALLEAYKSGAWVIGRGRTLEQVAMIIAALRAALSTPTEERQ